jgi:hypothetical protein
MKLLAALFAFAPLAHAAPDSELVKATLEASSTCENFVRFDDQNLYLGFGIYRHQWEEPRQPIPGHLTVVPLGRNDQQFILSTLDSALDATRRGDFLFVLTYSAIEEWNISSHIRVATYPTYAYAGGPMKYMEHAQAWARLGDKVVIAHGRLGVSFFDLRTRRLTNQFRLVTSQLPLESAATGVSVSGNTAYVVMDNFSLVQNGKPAFRGLILIDVPGERVLSELDGLDPGADAVITDGNRAIVSFGGNPVWKYSLANLTGRGLPEPDQRIWRFPRAGNPTGAPALDAKYYYTCFMQAPDKPGQAYKRVPLALNRAQLNLD